MPSQAFGFEERGIPIESRRICCDSSRNRMIRVSKSETENRLGCGEFLNFVLVSDLFLRISHKPHCTFRENGLIPEADPSNESVIDIEVGTGSAILDVAVKDPARFDERGDGSRFPAETTGQSPVFKLGPF